MQSKPSHVESQPAKEMGKVALHVFRKHQGDLLRCLKSSPTVIAFHLCKKGLIITETRDHVINTVGMASMDKAAILLADVQRVIGSHTNVKETFEEFCSVIKQRRNMKSFAGKLMKEFLTLCSLCEDDDSRDRNSSNESSSLDTSETILSLGTSETILTDKQLAEVMQALPEFTKWVQLGQNLGLSAGKLEVIKADCKGEDIYHYVHQMLLEWLKRNYDEDEDHGPPTWTNLAKAVKPIDNALARKIQDKYCTYVDQPLMPRKHTQDHTHSASAQVLPTEKQYLQGASLKITQATYSKAEQGPFYKLHQHREGGADGHQRQDPTHPLSEETPPPNKHQGQGSSQSHPQSHLQALEMNSHDAKCQALKRHCNGLRRTIQGNLENIRFELYAMELIPAEVRDQKEAGGMVSTIENRLAVDESVWDKLMKVLHNCNSQALIKKLSDQLRNEMCSSWDTQ